MTQEKLVLKGMSLEEMQEFVESLGEKKYRAAQLFSWIYAKGAQSFEEMTDISREFQAVLSAKASLGQLGVVRKSVSPKDGTTKFLFRLDDGKMIESVLIPPEDPDRPTDSDESAERTSGSEQRLTLCLSTQVGCPLDCKFCATGTMGFLRNLTAGEIIDQVTQAQRHAPRRITNLVYMGMGEPMLNYDNVMKSVDILTDDRSLNIGARHITISTAGYADRIRQMADERRRVKLALSLHSLDNAKRTKLMPITKKFSVDELIDSLEYYYKKTRHRPTFEYIPFDGFNDTESDVKRFVKLSKRIPCKVNIIPFHSIDFTIPSGFGATLKPTPRGRLEEFAQALREADITVMVRSSAGEDIEAACGQLAVEEDRSAKRPAGPKGVAAKTAARGNTVH
ncbi:MAG TPA: 23S rRNA (adenine(2503)-C(2))-methyltransferase RlmN [Bacteroidetes bacterium]|nr:23S rRNA (adenine(2503)-C(2))-methyltransferase RlmN [Bacteroidota bacterium]